MTPRGTLGDMPDISALLGDEAESLLGHTAKAIPREDLTLPGPDYIDRVFLDTDRNPTVLRNLGVAARPRPPRRHRLRVDPAGRPGHRALGRGVVRAEPRATSTRRTSSSSPSRAAATRSPPRSACSARSSRRYAHQHPLHREAQPQRAAHLPEQVRPDHVRHRSQQACDLGAAGVGATIYFGSAESTRQLQEVSEAFAEAHELGMFTVLWCYLRNNAFKKDGVDYHAVGRPHRPGQPPRRHDRGRHHQAEAAREQRRLHRRSTSARPTRSSTTS